MEPVPHSETEWPWKLPIKRWKGPARGRVLGYTLVDEIDYRALLDAHLGMSAKGYAIYGGRYAVARSILGLVEGDPRWADHINRDRLDNRRSNLRITTPRGNAQNRPSIGKSSTYRGVSWHPAGKWHANIMHVGKSEKLGSYIDERVAALAAAHRRHVLMDHAEPDPRLEVFALPVRSGVLTCEGCGATARVPGAEARYWQIANGQPLCEPCNGYVRPKLGGPRKPPRACSNCGRMTTHSKLGRCDSCYAFRRRNGRDR